MAHCLAAAEVPVVVDFPAAAHLLAAAEVLKISHLAVEDRSAAHWLAAAEEVLRAELDSPLLVEV